MRAFDIRDPWSIYYEGGRTEVVGLPEGYSDFVPEVQHCSLGAKSGGLLVTDKNGAKVALYEFLVVGVSALDYPYSEHPEADARIIRDVTIKHLNAAGWEAGWCLARYHPRFSIFWLKARRLIEDYQEASA